MPKVVCISGASRGIGRHLAEHFAEQGEIVVGCSRRESDFRHANYQHVTADISDEDSVLSLFRDIRKSHQRLDILINAAAVNPAPGPLALMSNNTFQEVLTVNIQGTFLMIRSAIKLMSKKQFGRIINFGSMATQHEVAGEACYTATKAAIVAMSRVVAKEAYKQGITCNVVSPAAIETELSAQLDQAALADILKRNAIPEFGEMGDVSTTVDWLIDDKCEHITGQEIFLGGA